jgi:hypothetical protein
MSKIWTSGWECKDNYPYPDNKVEYTIERGQGDAREVAAICWDYGLACIIEEAMNFRDGSTQ